MTYLICFILILFPPFFAGAGEDPFAYDWNDPGSEQDFQPYYSSLYREESPGLWYEECMSMLPLLSDSERRSWEQRMEEELLSWVKGRFEALLPADGVGNLEKAIGNQMESLLYRSDDNGILFDSAGDPLLRDPDLYASDRESWSRELETSGNEFLSCCETEAEALVPSILMDIPMDMRSTAEAGLMVSLGEYREAVRRETERLILWSSASFDYLRQQDNYSLRHKSEDETADALAERLVRETAVSVSEAEAVLEQGIDDLKNAAVDEAAFSVDAWEESFQREFQKGLDLWADAEKELLASRLQWELRSETKYLEAERLWDQALETFSSQRQEWIADISLLLEDGKAAWNEKEMIYQEQIDEIVRETELAAAGQENDFFIQVNTALELYSETTALLRSTEENVLFYEYKTETMSTELAELQTRLSGLYEARAEKELLEAELRAGIDILETLKEYSSGLEAMGYAMMIRLKKQELDEVEDALVDIRKEVKRYEQKTEPLKELLPYYRDELSVWKELQDSLQEQLTGTEDMLYSLEAVAVGYDTTVPLASLEQEIARRELETERLYRQWKISEAVTAYAELETAYRPTEAQTAEEFENCDTELLNAEQHYRDVFSALGLLREDLIESQEGLTDRQNQLEDARLLMREARDAYDNSFSIYQNSNPDVLEQLLDDLDKEIESWYGSGEEDSEREELYALYFRSGEWERRSILEEERLQLIRDLKGGELAGDADRYPDLGTLIDNGADSREILFTQRALEILESALLPDVSSEELELTILEAEYTYYGELAAELLAVSDEYDFPEGPELGSLESLAVILKECREGGVGRQAAWELMSDDERQWMQILTGDESIEGLVLPGAAESLADLEKALAERDAMALASSVLRGMDGSSVTTRVLLGQSSAEDFMAHLSAFSDPGTLLDWYHPLLENDDLPDYMRELIEAGIRVYWKDELDVMDSHAEVLAEELISLRDGLALFGEGEDDILAFAASPEGKSLFREAGYGAFLDEWDALGNPCAFFEAKDYDGLGEFCSWKDGTPEEFVSREFPDAGFLERQYLILRLEEGDTSPERLEGRWLLALYELMDSDAEDIESALFRAEILEDLQDSSSDDPLSDTTFLFSVMDNAIEQLLDSGEDTADLLSPMEYLSLIKNGEIHIRQQEAQRVEVEKDLEISLRDADEFRRVVVEADFKAYEERRKEYEEALSLFRTAQEELTGAQQAYLKGRAELDLANEECHSAKLAYQQAKEILDFASSGYNPDTANVYTIEEDRRKAYEESVQALEILEDIQAKGDTAAEIDELWASYRDEAETVLSLGNKLDYTAVALSRKESELNRVYGSSLGDMCDAAQNFIDFASLELNFVFDESMLEQEMTDFSSWKNSSLETRSDRYFSSDKAEETFSRDLMLWMNEMGSQGNTQELLKLFSYAYYHELDSMEGMDQDEIDERYVIDLFQNAQHKDLLKQDGDMIHGVNIGYEGDLDRYNNGEYEDVKKVFRNLSTGRIYKVFIGPEEWLRDQTADSLEQISSKSTLRKLYSFYKVLMFSSCITNDVLARAMEQDLSALAWDYIDDVARHEQRQFKRPLIGGYSKAGRDIRDKRRAIARTADYYSGYYDRMTFADEIEDFGSGLDQLLDCIEEKNAQTGGKNMSVKDLNSLMYKLTGTKPEGAQKDLLKELFATIPSSKKNSTSTLLQSLTEKLIPVRSRCDENLREREEELSDLRSELSRDLNASLASGDLEAFRTAAEQLYNSPVYLQQDFRDSRLDSIMNADNPFEDESLRNMKAYGMLLAESFSKRLEQVKAQRYAALQSELDEIRSNKSYWEERINALVGEGLSQWDSSAQSLIGKRISWRESFRREYEDRARLWEAKQDLLNRNRNSWLADSSASAIEAGSESAARQMGLNAESLAAEVSFSFIPDMNREAFSMQGMLNDALNGQTMDALLSAVDGMNRNIRGHDLLLSGSLPLIPANSGTLHNLCEQQDQLQEEIRKALASAQALRMKEASLEMERNMMGHIDDANDSVDLSVESRLRDEGYARSGDRFVRTVIIDSSLLEGNETEQQEILSYKYFEAPELDLGVDLSLSHLKTLNSDMIQASVNLAAQRLQNYLVLIFGTEEDDEELRGQMDKDFIRYLEKQEKAFEASGKGNDNKDEDSSGLFYFHLGYAPVMKEKKPEKVKVEGYGEFGRIFKAFAIQQARLHRGLEGMNAPWYSQKIWDDDKDNDGRSDSFFGAPNIRSVVDIAVSVAGSAFMGPFPALMIGMLDDAMFTLADLGSGILNAADAGFNLLKKAGTSLLTYGAGEAFKGLDNLSTFEGAGELFSDIGYKGLEISANSYGSAAINAMDADGFSWNSFNSQTGWDDMSSAYLSGLTGRAVSSALELGTFGFTGDTFQDAAAFTNLAGGLSASAVEYGMTGETMLNVLGIKGTGILELNIGSGKNVFNLGTGGTDISLGTLAAAGRGLYDYSRNIEINRAISDKDLKAGMRTLYSGADSSELKILYDQIISGEAVINTGINQEFEGYTTVDESGVRVIDLNKTGKSALDLAVLLSHEAFRDGLNNGSEGQMKETEKAVIAHMQTASELQDLYGSGYLNDRNNREADLLNRVLDGSLPGHLLSEYTMQNYDMSGDFWKLTDDGQIIWDGKKDLINENGEIIRIDKTGSFSLSLLNWFGKDNSAALLEQRGYDTENMSDSEIAYALMKSSGAEWNDTAYSEATGINSGAYVPRTVPGGQGANMSTLEDRLRFQLSEYEAFHSSKISQESPDIAVWVQNEDGDWINGMASTGCYYMSTLGAVQTQAGKLLTTEQINRITEQALEEGWLDVDEDGIFPTGDDSKTLISQLAFRELGEFGYLKFNSNSENADGSIIVGETINDNFHAREGNEMLDLEIFDPYENISYKPEQYINLEESTKYEYYDYQKYYWKQFERYYF